MQISVAEGLEDFNDALMKGVGNILREGPPGGRQQFLRRGIQLPQIGEMPTALVGRRVELEVNLIVATDEADLECQYSACPTSYSPDTVGNAAR